MAENSKIEWTDHTFNPWKGCTKISDGCAKCYAAFEADTRYHQVTWGPNGTRVKTTDEYWKGPKKWDRKAAESGVRARVFCASWADVFEEWDGPILDSKGRVLWRCKCGYSTADDGCDCPKCGEGCAGLTMDDLRRDLFALIDATPNLDWLLLTKRPENVLRMWPKLEGQGCCANGNECRHPDCIAFRGNVWLGTTIESDDYAFRWHEYLSKCRALCDYTFVSYEPALGPLDIRGWESVPNWIIYGCESGFGKRPAKDAWAASLSGQCRVAGVAFFLKQMVVDGQVSVDIETFPEHLQNREFPSSNAHIGSL